MSTTTESATVNVGPPTVAVVGPIVAIGVVISILLLVVAGVIGLVVGLVLTAVAAIIRARTFGREVEAHVLSGLVLHAADGPEAANLANLVDGLAVSAGVPAPELRVLDAPGANVMVVGTTPETAVVVVTTGLLDALDRIALEGVVARAIAAIRQGAIAGPSWSIELSRSAITRPFAPSSAADDDRDVLLDRDAVGLTRYPPGLIAALEACAAIGTEVAGAPAGSTPLWMVDPAGGDHVAAELLHRIEALRLL